MCPHHDLNAILAPELGALSAASTTFITPLASVLTTLVNEFVSLRTAHYQLQAQVSRIDAHLKNDFPHSIPSPPNTLPSESPIADPDLTQPPSPLPHNLTENQIDPEKSLPPNSQNHPLHHVADEIESPPLTPSPNRSGNNDDRLKRRRRSSKRPISALRTPQVEHDEKLQQRSDFLSSQQLGTGSIETPDSSIGVANAGNKCDAQNKSDQTKRNPLKNCDQNLRALPTTPTTEVKSKKRRSNSFSYEPIIEGYTNAAVAVKHVENIVARREAENCPPSFRPQRKSLSERTCSPCRDSLRAQAANAPDPDVEFQRLLRFGCRHKEKAPRPATPEGYWALDFAETPTQPP